MPRYNILATMNREVEEQYDCEVDANDPEEALDIVYHSFTEFPNSEITLTTRRRIFENTVTVNSVSVEFEREEVNDNAG